MDKKQKQLGMNPSTASHRLVKDTLFKFIVEAGYVCHKCGGELTRDTFSIEHKEPWLDSDDPVGMFFDQKNIAFSHLSCNVRDVRLRHKGTTKYPEFAGLGRKPSAVAFDKARSYDPQNRRNQYLRTGK